MQFIRFPVQIITSGIIEFMNKGHFRVYACIDFHKDRRKGWQSFPSLQTIQKESKLNRQTIQNAIKDLIQWGLIKKALIRRKKGGGYRSVYTVIKEPEVKRPLKRIREKVLSKKQRRDKKGRFTGSHKPEKRTGAERQHKPENLADSRHNEDHKPENLASAIKPENLAEHKSVNMANIQSSLSSIYPVKNGEQNHSLTKGEEKKKKRIPKIEAGEKAWEEAFGNLGRSK